MRIVKKPDGIGEDAGRIDNNFCPDLVLGSGFGISQDGATYFVAVFRQGDDFDIVGGMPSLIEQGAEDRYREASIVELAIQKFGPPIYVRHEIVHNRYVVDGLKAKGAVFVEDLSEIPDGDNPVVFSAHGVPKSVPAEASRRKLLYLDATCPLVSKVHREAERHFAEHGFVRR